MNDFFKKLAYPGLFLFSFVLFKHKLSRNYTKITAVIGFEFGFLEWKASTLTT